MKRSYIAAMSQPIGEACRAGARGQAHPGRGLAGARWKTAPRISWSNARRMQTACIADAAGGAVAECGVDQVPAAQVAPAGGVDLGLAARQGSLRDLVFVGPAG